MCNSVIINRLKALERVEYAYHGEEMCYWDDIKEIIDEFEGKE